MKQDACAVPTEEPKDAGLASVGKYVFHNGNKLSGVPACASCHGADATGGGDAGRDLATAPPDLTMIAARNGGTFPTDQVMSTIDGLDRGTHFSAAMPEFGAGDLGETVIVENEGLGTPVPMKLLMLTEYLESIQQ